MRQQFGEKGGPLLHAQGQQVDDHALGGILKDADYLADAWGAVWSADGNGDLQVVIVTFGINDAELVAVLMEPLENSSGERRFPAPRGTGEQDGGSIWAEDDWFIARTPDEDGMPAQGCGLKSTQVVRDQRLDHFAD